MLWVLFLGLFLVCVGMSVVFSVYLCLLWYASLRFASPSSTGEGKMPARGLSSSELQSLPGAGDGGAVTGTECAVCLDDIEAGQPARVLPTCQHAFHRPCADTWLSCNPACPVCRSSLLPPRQQLAA